MDSRKPTRRRRAEKVPEAAFNAQVFLDSSGVAKSVASYEAGETVFAQGDGCDAVCYIQAGAVKLSVLSKTGREAVVAMLTIGDFFGEGCLAGQKVRMGTATATTRSRVNFFLNKFKKLGFIEYDGELPITINSSLLNVVLHD